MSVAVYVWLFLDAGGIQQRTRMESAMRMRRVMPPDLLVSGRNRAASERASQGGARQEETGVEKRIRSRGERSLPSAALC